MQIIPQNILLIADAGLTGGTMPKLENIEELPPELRNSLLRGRVVESNQQTNRITLQLPGGQQVKATLEPPPAVGSRLTFLPQKDGTATLLKFLPPAGGGGQQQPQQAAAPQGSPASRFVPPQETVDVLRVLMQDKPGAQQPQPAAPSSSASRPQPGMTTMLSVAGNRPFPAIGATVMGQIEGPPENNQQVLRLANQTRLHIPVPPVFDPGSEVQLRITGRNQGRILSINSGGTQQQQTPQAAAPQSARTPTAQPLPQGTPLQPMTQVPSFLTAENAITANVVRSLPAQGGSPAQLALNVANPAGGAPVEVRVILPPNTPPPQPGSQIPISLNTQGNLQVGTPPTQASAPQAPPPAPSATSMQQPSPTTPPPAQPAPAPQAGQSTATVVNQGQQGQHTLALQNGRNVNVFAERNLPIGSQITLKVTPDGHAQITDMTLPQSASGRAKALAQLSLKWEGLEKAVQTLQKEQPEAAQQLRKDMPKVGREFLPQIMKFAEATTTQRLEAFFGRETLNVLRALGLDGMLQSDMSQLHTLQQRPESSDSWRALIFPYWNEDDDQPRQGHMFWRNQKSEHAPDQEHTRFVIGMTMSNLGTLQLDGLIQEKDMQLKLRTLEPWPEEDKKNLKKVVRQALEDAGLTGGIQVESTTFFPIDPLHDEINGKEGLDLEI